MITKEQRDEWRRLADAATPGEWREDDGHVFQGELADKRVATIRAKLAGLPYEKAFLDPDGASIAHCQQEWDNSDANAAFIAAARSAVPALLDALDEAERERDKLLEHLERHRTATAAGRESNDRLREALRGLLLHACPDHAQPLSWCHSCKAWTAAETLAREVLK